MGLIEKLNEINACKEDIKAALKEKCGDTYMDDVAFSGYADKIRALQLESGDTPAPTPSADYIYSNGYLTDGDERNEIINFIPYAIEMGTSLGGEYKEDNTDKFVIHLTCPIEIQVQNYENCDIIFTVEIPEKYQISAFDIKGITGEYEPYTNGYKENPRHENGEVIRDGITYKSYVRSVSDGEDYNSEDIATDTLDYRITIESK